MGSEADWPHIALEAVADDITVGHVGPMLHEYVSSGVPFLRSLNVQPHRISRDDLKFISRAFHERLAKSTLKPGDVVVVRTGKPGTASVIPDDLPEANCSDLVVVRPGARLDARFLAYYLNSAEALAHVDSRLVGAVQQHFNVGEARKLLLPLPELMEQRTIVGILGALDDRIDLNRRTNETLEAIAHAIFRSWFVDFDPVRAKMDGRQTFGMDAETAGLFPSSFDQSMAGPLPEGWQVRNIGEAVQVVGGSTPSTKEPAYWTDGSFNWATPKDLSGLQSPVLLDTERRITDRGLAQIGSGLLPKRTVLLSSRAPIGYLALAEVPTAVNQGFIAMICRGAVSPHYILQWARMNMDAIKGRANGTTFQEISKSNFRPLPIVIPNPTVLTRFDEIAEPLHQKLVANLRESDLLATTRDYLLPKLLSGEIRVKDAERVVGEVI